MKHLTVIKRGLISCLVLILVPLVARAAEELPHPETYIPDSPDKIGKKLYDDPTDLFVTRPFKKIFPP